jgi:hypothetical protein
MTDYAKAASDLKARLNAKVKRRLDLTAFFEEVRTALSKEVAKANLELGKESAPKIEIQQASLGEPTVELICGQASCNVSQDRSAPSVGAVIAGESGEKTITFLILVDESPIRARRLSLTPETEEKVDANLLAATFVEELIMGAP